MIHFYRKLYAISTLNDAKCPMVLGLVVLDHAMCIAHEL